MEIQDEFHAEMNSELDAENKLAAEETPADHWNKIMEIMETLKVQCADLEEKLKDFNKSAI